MLASDDSIRGALADALTVSPVPRSYGVLADELVESGLDLGADPEDRLGLAIQGDPRFSDVSDGLVFVPTLVEGTRWTVAVDADNAQEDFVRLDVDLAILAWWLITDDVSLIDDEGNELGVLETDGIELDDAGIDVVYGPSGWLEPFAGGLATVEVIGGALRWSPCSDEPTATTRQVDAIQAGFEVAKRTESYRNLVADEPVELTFAMDEVVTLEALLADKGAFADQQSPRCAPLLEAAGLRRRGQYVAEADFDWKRLDTWHARNRSRWEFGLDDEGAEYLAMLGGASDLVLAGSPDALGGNEEQRVAGAALLSAILAEHDDVAFAFWESQTVAVAPEELLRFADTLFDAIGEATPGVAWLRSLCLDAAGRVSEAIAALDEVVVGTDHALVLIDAAAFAADRGDAATARRLLERAGAFEHLAEHDGEFTHPSLDLDLLAELLPYFQRAKATAGRNDPCPCGSGRKYKACHLGKEQHPLEMRTGWLYSKAVRHLRRSDPGAIAEIAEEMAHHAGWETRQELSEAPPVADIALHEGGGFADFLAARADLLPDDEALLATQWTLVDRGVFEVEQMGVGTLQLFDIARGERITVTNVHEERTTSPGTLLLGRPLPVGDTYRAFGGFLPVSRSHLDELLDAIDEGHPLGIATVYAATLAPPRMSNTDGQPLAFHELRWQMDDSHSDVAAVDAVLREEGLNRNEGADPPSWNVVRDSINQPQTVIATMRLEGGVLVAQVNSDERAEEIGLLVGRVFPAATFLGDESRSVEEMMRDHDPSSAPPSALDPDDPAIREAVMKMMRGYEDRWIDDSIPALGGRTPREAVEDPVGREEVLQLLATFPDLEEMGGVGMDPERIRALLGL